MGSLAATLASHTNAKIASERQRVPFIVGFTPETMLTRTLLAAARLYHT